MSVISHLPGFNLVPSMLTSAVIIPPPPHHPPTVSLSETGKVLFSTSGVERVEQFVRLFVLQTRIGSAIVVLNS